MLVKSLSPYSHAFSSFSASFGTNPSWVPLKSSNSLCCSSKPRNLSRFLCLSTQNGGGFRENSGEVGRGDAVIIVDHGSRRKESNLMLRSYICSGSILGVSIASAPIIAHAMDVAGDALVDDHESQDLSEEEINVHHLLRLARKLWLPAFFFLTVCQTWTTQLQILFIKLTLFLLSTKPNPFSVYVFVDKSLYASKIEVQDYKLLCLADVEVRDQNFTLVGILRSWWPILHLPFWEAFSFFRNRIGSILVKTT
ncbi:hypothetical protein HKD37_19G052454 [Glycine soja]